MSDIVRITVRPHVKRYLTLHFGPALLLSEQNYAATLLRRLFEPFNKQDPGVVRPRLKESLGAMYDVCMGISGLRMYGGFISDKNLRAFSAAIDLLIKQEMYRWCQHPNATDEIVDYNIRRFQDFYGFTEDELSFDNLKRWYYRERERLEQRFLKVKFETDGVVIPLFVEAHGTPSDRVFLHKATGQTALFS